MNNECWKNEGKTNRIKIRDEQFIYIPANISYSVQMIKLREGAHGVTFIVEIKLVFRPMVHICFYASSTSYVIELILAKYTDHLSVT